MDVPNRPAAPNQSARCARCGCAFDCGSTTRPLDCWCASMPALPAAAASGKPSRTRKKGCLCPACYADALAASSVPAGGSGRGTSTEQSTD